MNDELQSKFDKAVMHLLDKIVTTDVALDAQQFSQACINLSMSYINIKSNIVSNVRTEWSKRS